jgi:dienelactone hydrolase
VVTLSADRQDWQALATELVALPTHRGLVPSTDGRTIAFVRHRDGGQVLVVGRHNGTGYQMTPWPGVAGEPVGWLDPFRLVLSRDETGGAETATLRVLRLTDGRIAAVPGTGRDFWRFTAADRDGGAFLATTTRPHGHDCPDPGSGSVWWVEASSGTAAPLVCLTDPTSGGSFSADGRLVAVRLGHGAVPALRVVDVDSRTVVAGLGSAGPVFWHPSAPLLFTQCEATGRLAAGVFDVASGEHRVLGDHDRDEVPLCANPSGTRLLCARIDVAEVRCAIYDLDSGRGTVVPTAPGVFTDPMRWLADVPAAAYVAGTDAVVTTRSAPVHPMRVVTVETHTGAVTPIEKPDDIPAPTGYVPTHVSYRSRDGHRVPALLYLPGGPVRGGVVMLHGGPDWLWFHDFEPAAQLWAAAGLAVIQPNVRGSAGYGIAHRDATRRDWGGVDLQDVLGAADHLVDRLDVPADRLGLYGASYGGYLAYLAALVPASPFAAACVWAAPSDLVRLYADAPAQYQGLLREALGDPAEDPDWWAARSPVTHAANLHGRLLIVHGALDPRVPPGQAERMRGALLAAGKTEGTDFTLHEFGGGHGSSDDDERLASLRVVGGFILDTLVGARCATT